ncbi:hypothetical protein [Paenibacillus sp. SN-8-1]|uniref:hypothetical protein n=1 Tax=Paenibacillus sp. SN-8-1 TaxID=3435409 RepID=UPI003D9A8083
MKEFHTLGTRSIGEYIVYEIVNGSRVEINKITDNHKDGLKHARQLIGNYLRNKGVPLDEIVQHQCFVLHERKNDPKHKWPVSQYLIGVPEKNK